MALCRDPESVLMALRRDPESVLMALRRDPESVLMVPCRDPESVPGLLAVPGRGQFGTLQPAAAPFGASRGGDGLLGSAHGTYRQMT
jgi:hypothetical protein